MRKSYIYFVIAFLLVLLSGCSDSSVGPDIIFSLKDRNSKEPQVEYTLSVSVQSFDFGYKTSSQSLTITSNDDWSIICNSNWLSVSKDKGSGSQSININVNTNNTSSERSATITVRGVNSHKEIQISVKQEASKSTIKVDKDYFAIDDKPAVLEVNVTAEDSWTVICEESWIQVSPSSGFGSQQFKIEVLENNSIESRKSIITIKGNAETELQTVTIEQKGKYLELSEDMLSFTYEGGSSMVTISSSGTYQYSCDVSWVSVSQDGNSLMITVSNNSGTQSRSAIVRIVLDGCNLTKEITILQSGISLIVDKTSITADGDEDSSHTISISTEQGWTATSNVDWIFVSPSSGKGNTSLRIDIKANPERTDRSGIVTIKADDGNEVRILITQFGANYLDLSENLLSFTCDGGSSTVIVSTSGTYQCSCNVSWVSVSLNGNSLRISVSKNNDTKSRSAKIKVSLDGHNLTKEITVEQKGISLIVDKTSITAGGDEDSSHTISISTEQGWTATADVNWISVSPSSGKGNSSLRIDVGKNPDRTERSGFVTIKADDGNEVRILITQFGANYLDLSENMLSFTYEGGSSTVIVSTTGTYQYSCTASWITTSSNGNALSISVSKNNTTQSRSAKVRVSLDGYNLTKEIAVEQKGISLIVDKTNISASGEISSSHTISILTEQSWTATSNVDWIKVSPNSGKGDFSLNFEVAINPEETERIGIVTVKVTDGSTVGIQVTQAGVNRNSININDFTNDTNWD